MLLLIGTKSNNKFQHLSISKQNLRTFTERRNARKRFRQDYYELLNVPPTASQQDIKEAFYAQCKIYHPDLYAPSEFQRAKWNAQKQSMKMMMTDSDEKQFYEIKNAYETLKDEEKRREYDRELLAIMKEPKGPPFSAYPNEPKNQHKSRPSDIIRSIIFAKNPAMDLMGEKMDWKRKKIFAAIFLLFIIVYFASVRIYFKYYKKYGQK